MRLKRLLTIASIPWLLLATQSDMQKAQLLEKEGKYKEAMLLYKKIALKNSPDIKTQENKIEKKQSLVLEDTLENKKDEAFIFDDIKKSFYDKHLDKIDDNETRDTVKEMISSNFGLSPYKMNYILPVTYDVNKKNDRKEFETKFQISFEKPLLHNLFGLDGVLSAAYTQTSWWQTFAHSSPFRETNYQPEIFLTFPNDNKNSRLKASKISLIHESNGEDDKSRSWNRVYAEAYYQFNNLFLVPKVWYRIPEDKADDDNPDIDKYLGYGDLTFIYPYKKHNFEVKLRNNLRFNKNNKGAIEINWSFPLPSSIATFGNYGFVQIFSGYGESLIDYDKEIHKIGLGIAFSR